MRFVLILVIAVACLSFMGTAYAGEEPARPACARLLVLSPGTDTAELTSVNADGAAAPVELAPLMFLFDGDQLSLPTGASAVLLSYADATRQTHNGPSVIAVTEQGLSVLRAAETPPVIEDLPMALEPVVVTGRTDIRGATMYTRGDEDNCLEPTYPVDTTVLPGEVDCTWVARGLEGELTVTLADANYEVITSRDVSAASGSALLSVEAGRQYYWRVRHPDIATSYTGFKVLDAESREELQAVTVSLGVAASDAAGAIAQITDVADLTYLLSVYQYYGLQREMQATLSRLAAVLLEN